MEEKELRPGDMELPSNLPRRKDKPATKADLDHHQEVIRKLKEKNK